MVQIERVPEGRIRQGDIIRGVEMVEYAEENNGIIEVSKILFPYVVVMTQDCDLEQDFGNRQKNNMLAMEEKNHDKFLMSIIVVPMYNYEHMLLGEHLSELEMKMQKIDRNKTPDKILKRNDNPRYHYIEFPNDAGMVPQVIDFKHYCTCNLKYLNPHKEKNYICSILPLYRESISQRFANYLSRIGLPAAN